MDTTDGYMHSDLDSDLLKKSQICEIMIFSLRYWVLKIDL